VNSNHAGAIDDVIREFVRFMHMVETDAVASGPLVAPEMLTALTAFHTAAFAAKKHFQAMFEASNGEATQRNPVLKAMLQDELFGPGLHSLVERAPESVDAGPLSLDLNHFVARVRDYIWEASRLPWGYFPGDADWTDALVLTHKEAQQLEAGLPRVPVSDPVSHLRALNSKRERPWPTAGRYVTLEQVTSAPVNEDLRRHLVNRLFYESLSRLHGQHRIVVSAASEYRTAFNRHNLPRLPKKKPTKDAGALGLPSGFFGSN
jgi:hypothetical protein